MDVNVKSLTLSPARESGTRWCPSRGSLRFLAAAENALSEVCPILTWICHLEVTTVQHGDMEGTWSHTPSDDLADRRRDGRVDVLRPAAGREYVRRCRALPGLAVKPEAVNEHDWRPYGINTTRPNACRPSMNACAAAASASGNVRSITTFSSPCVASSR